MDGTKNNLTNFTQLVSFFIVALFSSTSFSADKVKIFDGKYNLLGAENLYEEVIIKNNYIHWEYILEEDGLSEFCDAKYQVINTQLNLSERVCNFVRNDPNNPPPHIPKKKEDKSIKIRKITKTNFELYLPVEYENRLGWRIFEKVEK